MSLPDGSVLVVKYICVPQIDFDIFVQIFSYSFKYFQYTFSIEIVYEKSISACLEIFLFVGIFRSRNVLCVVFCRNLLILIKKSEKLQPGISCVTKVFCSNFRQIIIHRVSVSLFEESN